MKRALHLVVTLLCLAAVAASPALCLHSLGGSQVGLGATCGSNAHSGMPSPDAMTMPAPPPPGSNQHSCCTTHPRPQPAVGAVHFELPPLAVTYLAVTAYSADLSAATSAHPVQELFSPPPAPRLLSRRI